MGLGYSRIQFEDKFPTLEQIQKQYFDQTGLNLWVTVDLHVNKLNLSYLQMISLLEEDAKEVQLLQTEYREILEKELVNFEKITKQGHANRQQLYKLNRLGTLQFHIAQLYSLEFKIENDVIEIETDASQYYGIVSLEKALIDLGGSFVSIYSPKSYPDKWKKLKKWHEYKWYNRPRK